MRSFRNARGPTSEVRRSPRGSITRAAAPISTTSLGPPWPGRLIRGRALSLKSTASVSIGLPRDGERAEFLTEDSVFIEFIKYLTKIDKDLFEPTLAREVDFNFNIKRVREL